MRNYFLKRRSRSHRIATLMGGVSDTVKPTVTITSTESSPSVANPIPLTFTLSESSVNFAVGDITVGAGGSIGNFAGSGTSYTADLTVTSASATITVNVAADSFTDAAGNGNTAATQFSITSALIVLDNFTDTRAVGAVNGTAATPGPGTRVVVDTETKISVGLGVLDLAGGKAVPATGDPGLWYGTGARAAGKVALVKQFLANTTGTQRAVGWDTNQTGDLGYFIGHISGSGLGNDQLTISTGSPVAANDIYMAVVQRGTGMFYLVKGGGLSVHSDWSVLWVRESGTDANLFPAMANNNKVTTLDYFKVAQLAAPWATDDGPATQVLAGARSAGDTFTHQGTGGCLIYFTVTTLPSAGNMELRFRIQDASNYWQLLIDSSGNYTLNSVAAGVATARLGPTSGVTNGMRMGIRATPTQIYIHKGAATGALHGTTTGGAVTRIEAWPFNLTGTALTQLTNLNHNVESGFQINQATMTNAPTRLTMPNGESDSALINQVVHPDVCRPNPAGKWNGYTYWMCIMPYPETNTLKELPAVVVSDDMQNWSVPAGGSLIVSPNAGAGVISSDNDLFYDEDTDTLHIVYRNTDDATYDSICERHTVDGITWSDAVEILNVPYHDALSPAVVKKADGTFEMFTIHFNRCDVYTAAAITGPWTGPTICFNRTPYSDLQQMWHVDVYLEDGNYLALVTIHTTGDYLWLASSTDGRRWHIADEPLMYKSVSGWDNQWLYRGSIGVRTATGFDVIYSAKSNDGAGDWGSGRTQLTIPLI
jgi:hypothetical protein